MEGGLKSPQPLKEKDESVFNLKLRIQQLEEKLSNVTGGTNGEQLLDAIEEKDQEIRDREREKARLEEKLAVFVNQIAAMNDKHAEDKETNHKLSRTLRDTDKRLAKEKARAAELDTKVQEGKVEHIRLQQAMDSSLAAAEAELESERKRHTEERERERDAASLLLEKEQRRAAEELSLSRAEAERLRSERAALQLDVTSEKAAVSNLRLELADMEREKDRAVTKRRQLFEQATEQKHELERMVKHEKSVVTTLRRENALLAKDVRGLTSKVADKQELLHTSESLCQTLRQQGAALSTKLLTAEGKLREATAAHEKAHQESNDKMSEQHEQIGSLQLLVQSERSKHIAETKAIQDKLMEEVSRSNAVRRDVHNAEAKTKRIITELEGENKRLLSRAEDGETRASKLQRERDELLTHKEGLKKAFAEGERKSDTRKRTDQRVMMRLKEELADSERELLRCKEKVVSLKHTELQVAELKDKVERQDLFLKRKLDHERRMRASRERGGRASSTPDEAAELRGMAQGQGQGQASRSSVVTGAVDFGPHDSAPPPAVLNRPSYGPGLGEEGGRYQHGNEADDGRRERESSSCTDGGRRERERNHAWTKGGSSSSNSKENDVGPSSQHAHAGGGGSYRHSHSHSHSHSQAVSKQQQQQQPKHCSSTSSISSSISSRGRGNHMGSHSHSSHSILQDRSQDHSLERAERRRHRTPLGGTSLYNSARGEDAPMPAALLHGKRGGRGRSFRVVVRRREERQQQQQQRSEEEEEEEEEEERVPAAMSLCRHGTCPFLRRGSTPELRRRRNE